jgi:hypothetical protein
MNPLPAGDYLKYMPKFTGEGDITAEEHLAAFYNNVDNLKVSTFSRNTFFSSTMSLTK